MADWDADSRELSRNLRNLLGRIRDAARRREVPSVDAARRWHASMMVGLAAPHSSAVGRFRGETGLEHIEVQIGTHRGVNARDVPRALADFEATVRRAVARIDSIIAPGDELSVDMALGVIDLCAWTRAEWIRIHPFANGNGRTARLWPTASPCAMVCHPSCVYARDPMAAMATRARRRCAAIGVRPPMRSVVCCAISCQPLATTSDQTALD